MPPDGQKKEASISTRAENAITVRNLFSGSIHELLHPPAGQIPFLDGLRSIAVLLVVSAHMTGSVVAAYGSNFYSRLPFVVRGWIGVDLFFVLSGFFIGTQLWKELQARGTVAVGQFMLRRGFRIWPLYFFVLLCVLLFGTNPAAKGYGWTDVVFITNYYNRGLVAGSWSLCTEEQFYIFTPIALYLLSRRIRIVQNYRPLLWGAMLAVPLLRAAIWIHVTGGFFRHDPALFYPIYFGSVTHCDGLIMGLIVANLWVTRETPSRFTSPGIWIAIVVAAAALYALQKDIFDFSVLALLFGSLVWLGLRSRIGLFNSKIFYWLSRLSYGMYLNHEYMCPWIAGSVLPRIGAWAQSPTLANIAGVLIATVLSAGVALITFCCVEYPFLQMRSVVLGRRADRFASHQTASALQ